MLQAAPDSPPPGSMRDGGAAAASRRYLHARLAPLERRVEQLRGHRLALVRPTQLAQDLSVPSPQIQLLELAASAVFCCCVCGQIPYSITRDDTSHMHLCVFFFCLLYYVLPTTALYITALSVHAQPALRLRELGLDARLRGAVVCAF